MNTRMAQTKPLRLGTRNSLLARAQSKIVADQLMAANPGLEVDFVTLSTRGDKDLTTPLAAVNDLQFFSDELDSALAAGDVDFCVHSWKDIDGPRPANFVRAAVPRRALPHDVLLFRRDIIDVLRSGKELRIGTSSARRQVNVADFLQWALPNNGVAPAVNFCTLRGPVDQRVMRIASNAGEQQLDGIVLALAGLERLWHDTTGRDAIAGYLNQARWMVMPLSEVPAAAAQGALAIETLADNRACRQLLQSIHHPETEFLVGIEQALLREHAGDGGAELGATAVTHPELGYVARLRGRTTSSTHAVRITCTARDEPESSDDRQQWNGNVWARSTQKRPITGAAERACNQAEALFIAHADALTEGRVPAATRCWTSGKESWMRLANQGVWIEGCADNLGFESIGELLASAVLHLPPLSRWTALTHRDAVTGWASSGIKNVVATYSIDIALDEQQVRAELEQYTDFYWSSARQYATLRDWLPAKAQHACGAGKTLHALRAAGLSNVRPFPSRQEWRR